ncbi:hypothetical protein ABIA33_005013 [Streptacidiphilus sp. MAP12-16]|uniref:lactonase family protein n=1 Tax=Streptacidiphilus sp. MAP12-16 TaxID=3156300 RepID=UPI0035171CF2
MHASLRLGIAAATALATTAVLAVSAPFATAGGHDDWYGNGGDHAVFVQTDNLAGNQIIAYHRHGDGHLTKAASYDTSGLGGALDGSVVDHLASQGSLTYDPRHALLYAVNAGSDTVSVFSVDGEKLKLRQVIGSGGTFPVSVAVHDDLVYVLNALDGGSIQGYTVDDQRLHLKKDWHRSLGLDPNATPVFTHTPGQVGFVADGSQLVVTTKANGNNIDVFNLNHSGAPSKSPEVTADPDAVPFGFVSSQRRLFMTEAGPNALSTFTVHRDGTATKTASALTGQQATCWVTFAGKELLYTSNAGSSSLSGYRVDRQGNLTHLGTTTTDPGTVDAASASGGRFLYVQTGANGILDEFAVNRDGSLTSLGSETVPGAVGGEGIVAF